MDRNLEQLPAVAGFASSLGLDGLSIFPVIRRDEIPIQFPQELTTLGEHRPDFAARVRSAVGDARCAYPEMAFTVCNPLLNIYHACLGPGPGPYAAPLPAGAGIHSV